MDAKLRQAWKERITAEDIDAHLRAIGQAEANASLVAEMLQGEAPPCRVLFAGAGTGQMFDFAPEDFLRGHRVIFTDINLTYLLRLRDRAAGRLSRCCPVMDDIEQSSLAGPFDVVVAVLLLEHVEWRKALDTMTGWSPRAVHAVIQRNPPDVAAMLTPSGPLPPSIRALAGDAHPQLMDEAELASGMRERGYAPGRRRERAVAAGKAMVGLTFNRG